MKCIQIQGTKRCENDAAVGSNYCPAHMFSSSDSPGGPERSILYCRIGRLSEVFAEHAVPEAAPASDDPVTEEKWNPEPSKS